jgi:hypothetical protein
MTAPIFISYSSKDRGIAETICGALENRGLKCWMSSRDIGPGENFQEAIIRAIRTSSTMVIVFSGNSNNSDEVKKEVALAGQHKLVVVPVRVEDVVPAEAFQYELATRQWIDMFENWEHAIERLATQIRSVLAAKSSQEAAPRDDAQKVSEAARPVISVPPRPAVQPRRSSAVPLTLAAVVLIAASAGGVWWWKNHQLAKDNDAWDAAELRNSVAGYQNYLQEAPHGRHADEADLRIDGLEWEAAVKLNTVAGYETYKEIEAQHGRHLADADAGIATLKAAAKAAADAAAAKAPEAAMAAQQAALASQQAPVAAAQQPSQGNQPTALEEADFKRALETHTSAEYRKFLATHGSSVHVAEIRQRLASCQMVKTGMTVAQKIRIQATGQGTGGNRFQACQIARQDGLSRLDKECPGGTVTWLRNQPLSFTPAAGCSIMVYGACATRASQAEAERCR